MILRKLGSWLDGEDWIASRLSCGSGCGLRVNLTVLRYVRNPATEVQDLCRASWLAV